MSTQEYSSAEESLDYDYYYYYNMVEDCEPDPNTTHPEYFEYECLTEQEAKAVLNESVETVSKALQITPALAKMILQSQGWNIQDIVSKYLSDFSRSFMDFQIKTSQPAQKTECPKMVCNQICTICSISQTIDRLRGLACEHLFCEDCWMVHLEVQVTEGNSTNIKCMACEMLAPEDFVLALLNRPSMRDKYQQLLFREHVRAHPQLTNCPGPDCEVVIKAKIPSAKQVICKVCKATFCFVCGEDYHAPTDCSTIRKWLTKCSGDSKTASYISTHTKSCPKCQVSIVKDGGCNHVMCTNCTFEFCWMCMSSWRNHTSELYTCSRYTRDPNIADQFIQFQTKAAVQKYLHYYSKWQNHSNSLKLEEQKLQLIRSRITERVIDGSGTWIDWNSLLDATTLLFKSRHTLKYTYPYAYYMEAGPRKQLFEYQQAIMEAQIEDLAWKIEMADMADKSDLVNQMDIVEKTRISFLEEFAKFHVDFQTFSSQQIS